MVGITGVTFLLIYKSDGAQIYAFPTFPNAHRTYRITERASGKDMTQCHRPINSSINSSSLFIAIKNDNHLTTE